MGFLDKARKLAEQAIDKANDAIADARTSTPAPESTAPSADSSGPNALGTPYVEGMLGRPGWREKGLVDPAAVLPMWDRDRAGIPHSTKSEIVEEPYGMGRRWTAEGKSAALFYRVYPEHQSWTPPGGTTPS